MDDVVCAYEPNDNQVQQQHKLAKPVGEGVDEHGPYKMIPLSMVKGGQLKPFKVYTKPMKHIMKDTTPAPRGWYKAKNEPPRVRPRPCYTEALLTTPYGGFCPINCGHCLHGETRVNAPEGVRWIKVLQVGDTVQGLDGSGKLVDSKVLAVTSRTVDSYYDLATANGLHLFITSEHPIYVYGKGWVQVQDLDLTDKVRLRLVGGRAIELLYLNEVDESLEVWDIQTSVENFFANGILVHNCYINNGTRGYRATGLPVAHYKYPAAMKKWVAKLMVSGAAYITSFSEPFHPLEDTYHITRDLTQVFLDEGLPIFYLSRMLPPEWAVEALLENPYSYMQWSVNTSNPDHYRRFSPGSFTLDEVYDEIIWLRDNGIFVSIQCNPIIAGITTLDEVVQLVHDMAGCDANHIIFKFVEQVANNRKIIVDRMHQRGLPRVAEFDDLFSQVIGGVYTIQEDVRVEWLDVLLEETRKAEITMSLCYEYSDNGFAGESLGPWYTTAKGGCHGQTVPMFYRPAPGEPFEPLPGCWEHGCLYCEEHGTQVCDNDKLPEAGKLTYKSLRSVQLVGDAGNWDLPGSCPRPDEMGKQHWWNPDWKTDAEIWGWEG